MSGCYLCPRECGADRSKGPGMCGAASLPYVGRAALHHWEEPCISGVSGSGAIFFCGCNMRCVFCQNHEISRGRAGRTCDADGLASMMLALQAQGAHNINLVSPAPFLNVLTEAIPKARSLGLCIPIVYNTNAYEKASALKALEGLVDIYLPDLKYVSQGIAQKYSGTGDYFTFASSALEEMRRQVGGLQLSDSGIAARGMIIRHLVLPGSVDETRRVLDYIAASFPGDTAISLMSQYVPCYRAAEYPALNRRLMKREYDRAVEYCLSLGLENVFIQGMDSADGGFTPDFDGSTPDLSPEISLNC